MVEVTTTAVADVKLITTRRFGDARGIFSEVYSKRDFGQAGIDIDFVQDNYSLSRPAGTIRGLHFQSAPHAQAKLVRVVRGAVLDIAVDLRRNSPTYGHHISAELSDDNGLQIFIPVGFAHGFCTLKPDTEVIYKTSAYYAPSHDHGVAFDDPALKIAWPVEPAKAILSEKDRKHPKFSDLPHYFG